MKLKRSQLARFLPTDGTEPDTTSERVLHVDDLAEAGNVDLNRELLLDFVQRCWPSPETLRN